MKKLILGLLLTVGVSGVSFAGEIKKNVEKKDVKSDDVTNCKYDELVADCTIVTVYIGRDSSGKVIDRTKFVEEATGDACADAPGGIIYNFLDYNFDDILRLTI